MQLKNSIEDQLEQELQKKRPGSWQSAAWNKFRLLGLPKRRHEAFQYVPLDPIFDGLQSFSSDEKIETKARISFTRVLPESSPLLVLVDGVFHPELSHWNQLPNQVIIMSLTEAMQGSYSAFFHSRKKILIEQENDPFALLSGAFFSEGIFLYVPPQVKIDTPVEILSIASGKSSYISPRVHVILGMGAKLEIVETKEEKQSIIHSSFIDIALEEEATCQHTLYNPQKLSSIGSSFLRGTVKKKAFLSSFLATFGSASLRHDYTVDLLGEDAAVDLKGIACVGESNHAHIHVHVKHSAPFSRSSQLFKNVFKEEAKGSFTGKIYVAKEAQKTEAYQLNNNLLLSDEALACSKPNLEIFADDVKASHGATVAQIDQEQLLYLQTRGIKEKEAKALLTKGFCEEMIEQMSAIHLQRQVALEVAHFLS